MLQEKARLLPIFEEDEANEAVAGCCGSFGLPILNWILAVMELLRSFEQEQAL